MSREEYSEVLLYSYWKFYNTQDEHYLVTLHLSTFLDPIYTLIHLYSMIETKYGN